MRTGYIYELVDPRTDEVRYIGQTVLKPQLRLSNHMSQYASKTIYAWVDELRSCGLKPSVRTIEEVSIDILDEREIYWIKAYLNEGKQLLNIYKGDEPTKRFELRMPLDLRAEVEAFAAGDGVRPPCSLNAALQYLIERGMRELGEWEEA